MKITIFSPSGIVVEGNRLYLARQRLEALGVSAHLDSAALDRYLRFAGTDQTRLDAIHRAAKDDSKVAMAARGGYGLSRLLNRIDWDLIASSVQQGKYWVGHSDFTVLSLGLLAHTGFPSWAGPMALSDFGRMDASVVRVPAIDQFTLDHFFSNMNGKAADANFQTDVGHDGLKVSGKLWGSNLTMLCSLLGTQHWPDIDGGILFLEDINEQPYCLERMLIQLHSAGVLDKQKAILLGDFSGWQTTPLDKEFRFKHVLEHIRSICKTPIITNLPFGHIHTKLTLPVGVDVDLTITGQEVNLNWGITGFDTAVYRAGLLQSKKTITTDEAGYQYGDTGK